MAKLPSPQELKILREIRSKHFGVCLRDIISGVSTEDEKPLTRNCAMAYLGRLLGKGLIFVKRKERWALRGRNIYAATPSGVAACKLMVKEGYDLMNKLEWVQKVASERHAAAVERYHGYWNEAYKRGILGKTGTAIAKELGIGDTTWYRARRLAEAEGWEGTREDMAANA